VPDSSKLVFTASGHHSITAGSLVLLDTSRGVDGDAAMRRLTPEVCFPEAEGWPVTYYANPYPLSEDLYLCAWSDRPLGQMGAQNRRTPRALPLRRVGQLELVYRDPDLSSGCPVPYGSPVPPASRRRPGQAMRPHASCSSTSTMARRHRAGQRALTPRRRRAAQDAAKHEHAEPGRHRGRPRQFVVGTVPVEADGSAHFVAPAGVTLFFQALDEEGAAVRTMRSAAYAQPGESQTCIGCHENRLTAHHSHGP